MLTLRKTPPKVGNKDGGVAAKERSADEGGEARKSTGAGEGSGGSAAACEVIIITDSD